MYLVALIYTSMKRLSKRRHFGVEYVGFQLVNRSRHHLRLRRLSGSLDLRRVASSFTSGLW